MVTNWVKNQVLLPSCFK